MTPDAPARPGSVAHTTVELAAFVATMRSRLAELTTASGWRRRVELSRAALMDALGDPPSIRRWPVDEQESFDAVLAALDRLADLDALEDEPAPGAFAARWTRSSPRRRVASDASVPASSALRSARPSASISTPSRSWVSPRDCSPSLGVRTRSWPTATAVSRSTGSSPCARPTWVISDAPTWPRSLRHPDIASSARPGATFAPGGSDSPSRYLLETASSLAGRRIFGSEFARLTHGEGLDAIASFAVGRHPDGRGRQRRRAGARRAARVPGAGS